MYEKLLKLLDDPKLSIALASFLLALLTWLTRQLSMVPRFYREKSREKRNLQSVIEGQRRDKIMRDLKATGAKYIHLIRYHNGGKSLLHGIPIYMSVDMEKTGEICDKCITKCRIFNGYIDPIMDDWQRIRLQGSWFEVVKNTVMNPGKVNIVLKEDLDAQQRDIWEKYVIEEYHEILVKHKRECFYCIGLFFCTRFNNRVKTDGTLSLAARQMANLL